MRSLSRLKRHWSKAGSRLPEIFRSIYDHPAFRKKYFLVSFGLCFRRFGNNCWFPVCIQPGPNPSGIMGNGLGLGNDRGYLHQRTFGNGYFVETGWSQRSLSYCPGNEHGIDATHGNSHESCRLWNDGGSSHHPGNLTVYSRGGFFGGVAVQLLEIKKTWEVLPWMTISIRA